MKKGTVIHGAKLISQEHGVMKALEQGICRRNHSDAIDEQVDLVFIMAPVWLSLTKSFWLE